MFQVFGHTMKASVYKTSLQCVDIQKTLVYVVRRCTKNIGAVLVRRRTEKYQSTT